MAGLCILTALLSTPVFAADSGAQALDNAFVKGVKAGDIEAVVALYAADATLYPPGRWSPATLEGRFSDVASKTPGKWLYILDHASAPLPPPPK